MNKQNGFGFHTEQIVQRSLFKNHAFRIWYSDQHLQQYILKECCGDWVDQWGIVTDSGKLTNQRSLLANNTAPITPPNQSREPISRVKLMRSRVLSDAVMDPDRFPLRKSFFVYKPQTVIVKYCNEKTLAIISLNSIIFFKRSCIFFLFKCINIHKENMLTLNE